MNNPENMATKQLIHEEKEFGADIDSLPGHSI
jgi:hypothetical protein